MRAVRTAGAGLTFMVGPTLALGLLLAGCFGYVPVTGDDPTPGSSVRLRLSNPAAVELSDRVGHVVRSVEGPLVGATADSLAVDVGWRALYAGTVFEGRRDTLSFHRTEVLEMDERKLSRTRTGLLGAGFIAAAILVIRSLSGGGSVGSSGNGGNPI